jgi:hypothetical protein
MQRPEIFTCRKLPIRLFRLPHGGIRQQFDDGIDGRIHLLNPFQVSRYQFNGRDLARADALRHSGCASIQHDHNLAMCREMAQAIIFCCS